VNKSFLFPQLLAAGILILSTMKKWWFLSGIYLTGLIIVSCFEVQKRPPSQQVVEIYRNAIAQLIREADALVKKAGDTGSTQNLQDQFKKTRIAYKQIEWMAEYYQPYTARFINGPALQEIEPEDRTRIIQPEGFQVIEELLFPVYDSSRKAELVEQVQLLRSNIGRLQTTAASLETTDAHIFDALRLQLFRIISLGISGFDSPVAQNSIEEASASLKGVEFVLSAWRNDLDKALVKKLDGLFAGTQKFLSSQRDFISLDRMQLITGYLNPVSETILLAQNSLNIPVFKEPRLLRADAKNLFAENIFDPDFYAPDGASAATEAKKLLGARLFYDPVLSANNSRSCASCHRPDKAFADGLKTNTALNSLSALKRNTPTLLNAALQPALFYDTRVNYLEDQAKAVIINKEEMHGSMEKAVVHLRANLHYRQLFQQAYAGEEITEQHIKNAIAVFVRSLVALNSRFDQYMRGQKNALSKTEIDGFNLFMGKAKCGTCHFAPLFNGNNPPNFNKIDAEVIGVPSVSDTLHPQLDGDKGKYYLNSIDLYRFAFKTPTVRNSALTAPYMHNGVYDSLEEVIEFYNRGGGKGLGLFIENQTLPEDRLHLSSFEKNAIVAFLKSLNDTTVAEGWQR
jgi:cytochrome c peroxidase